MTGHGTLLILGAVLVNASYAAAANPSLADGNIETITLNGLANQDVYIERMFIQASSSVTFNVTEIPAGIAFLLFQVHTYQYNVTLSYDQAELDRVSNRSVFGSNLGLYVDTSGPRSTRMYLKNDNIRPVEMMIAFTAYDANAPIPGGCNMEFDTEIAPYEKLAVHGPVVTVDLQPPSPPTRYKGICENNPSEYAVYQMYLPVQDFTTETYFSTLKEMLTVDDILRNANQMPSPSGFSPMRRVHSAYIGVGSIYVAVASYNGSKAAYVPVFSYACNPVLYPESCKILNDSFSKFVVFVVFFLGLISVFQGPRCLYAEMCLPPLFVGGVVGYIVALVADDYSNATNLWIAIGFGMLFAILFSPSGWCKTCLGGLVYSLLPGFFFACLAYFVGADAAGFLGNVWIFWTIFAIIVLLVALVLSVCVGVNTTIICAIYGSFMMVLPIDYYAGSSLKYIIINLVRRATVPEFAMAIVRPPFQSKDEVLAIFWILLFVLRIVRQFCPDAFVFPKFKKIRRAFFVNERTPLLR